MSAARGNTAAKVKLRQHLARYEAMAPVFAPLAGVVRRLLAGERDPGAAVGLGPLDAPVAARALAALRGEVEVPVALWPALHLSLALGNFVGAAAGDPGTAQVTREQLAALRADPAFAPLAPVLAEILDGSRDPGLVDRPREPVQRAVVATVLHYLDGVGGEGWAEKVAVRREGGGMEQEPRVNDVRIGPDGELEFYDGAEWVPYPDLPDEAGPPSALWRPGDVS